MTEQLEYVPGPAQRAEVRKEGDKWTLILVKQLRHSPQKVWQALTDPPQLREWAPFVVDGSMDKIGSKVNLTWVGNPVPQETTVTRAESPELLEYGDIRWELQPSDGGTRLTLWHKIDRRYISWGAAGWHISFDVLEHYLAGYPIGRIAGADAMKSAGWKRLVGEYAKQFGADQSPGS
jgi:uncharacterized protein YndB with AHSA1/START domain